jgi:hypothetical protein
MADDEFSTSEDERRFYAAVGRAITGWADLEDVLFRMTLAVLGCTMERAAIVFYRTPTIDSRLTLTNDLLNSFFPKHRPGEQPDPRIKRWRELQTEIKTHLPTRNRLAHHGVAPILEFREISHDEVTIEIRTASVASHGEQLRKPDQTLAPLTLEDVQTLTRTTSRLVNDLRNFDRQEVSRPNAKPGERGVPRTLPQGHLDTDQQEAPLPPPGPSPA